MYVHSEKKGVHPPSDSAMTPLINFRAFADRVLTEIIPLFTNQPEQPAHTINCSLPMENRYANW
ncbi:hypothetical protein GZ77_00100 [Endozoicomonas montiporae]|uniref:Uncharacterized protein n=1 Tax=Endozoicomonas montiporae TaxID=1027273 RepID=A0A081N9M2_9GAMM|nr:hypothetical protein GZ77_00100 [Endozoicomonas montiporae]